MIDFGKIKTSESMSSVFGIAGGSSTSEFEDFKYEIIDVMPIH